MNHNTITTTAENLGENLLLSDKGLFVPADNLLASKDNYDRARKLAIDLNRKTISDMLKAPAPKIRVPFGCVLVRALPPRLVDNSGQLILTRTEQIADERYLEQLKFMNENVRDEQQIVLKGRLVEDFQVGEVVKINYNRFRSVKDTIQGQIETFYDIPTYTIEGMKYIMIDQRDILYAFEENHQLEEIDETF